MSTLLVPCLFISPKGFRVSFLRRPGPKLEGQTDVSGTGIGPVRGQRN